MLICSFFTITSLSTHTTFKYPCSLGLLFRLMNWLFGLRRDGVGISEVISHLFMNFPQIKCRIRWYSHILLSLMFDRSNCNHLHSIIISAQTQIERGFS